MGITSKDIAAQRAMIEWGNVMRERKQQNDQRERLRDTFAAAALTGLLSRSIAPEQAMSQYVRIAAAYADAMLRERERTNHDAVPDAIASPSESSVPLGNGGGCGRTDKPVTLPAMGTGDIPVSRTRGRVGTILSEAEIDALEYVVEEGRIASMDDYGILRSLLVRVRPEWERESYEESDEKRTNTTMSRDATPGEGSVQGKGTVGMADIAYEAAENLQGVCKTFDQWSRETAGVMHRLARHIELLESRVPSDAEREAISFFAELRGGDFDSCLPRAATLRELLERLK